jgi:hypothetical protein
MQLRKLTNHFHSFAAPSQPDKLEQVLYPPFAAILGGDISG